MSLTATVESFTERLPELKVLFPAHWEKLALDKDQIPLDPQYEVYAQYEARGELLFIALRDGGRMVGYWSAHVAPGLHYQSCLTAMMDMWNVLPEYENGVAAMILMKAVEREYRRRGVNRSIVSEKIHRPCGKAKNGKPEGRLYRAFGYEPAETHYSKLIGY